MDVGVAGGSGYAGAELLRLLAQHPALKIRTVTAGRAAGRDLADVFPHLGMRGVLAPAEADAFHGCELVFLATPHDASLRLVPALLEQGAAVVDLSGAFRLDAPTFSEWYALPHTARDLAPAPYGLPELFRDALVGARLVANPGCYPTAALLALAPLAGLVDPASISVTGMSGSSGAGKGAREDLHVSHALHNVAPYGVPGHRHTPEIESGWQALAGGEAPVSFVPHLVPMTRGLLCTVVARLTAEPAQVRAAFDGLYEGEPFVRVLPGGAWPHSTHVYGSNSAHVGVAVDARAQRVVAACAIDNLGKGAAGQAIQNANILLGLSETAGLPSAGMYP